MAKKKDRNLKRLKMKMRMSRDWRKTLVRSSMNEILIDLDGDSQPDIAIMDAAGDGNADTIAVDLTGDGEFNLYFTDRDGNGIPDVVYVDENGDGDWKLLGMGKEVEDAMIAAANRIQLAIAADEFEASVMEEALDELDKDVRRARKELGKQA